MLAYAIIWNIAANIFFEVILKITIYVHVHLDVHVLAKTCICTDKCKK